MSGAVAGWPNRVLKNTCFRLLALDKPLVALNITVPRNLGKSTFHQPDYPDRAYARSVPCSLRG